MRLNDEEVDEFMNIADDSIEGLLGNGVIFARAELGSQAIVQDSLTGDLGENGDAQDHPGKLEGVADDIEISGHEN